MTTFRLIGPASDQEFDLASGRSYVVGRAVTSDIPVFDPTISRRHAELVVSADGVAVRDADSSNGTFINGARVTEGTLRPEEMVTFGKVLFQLRRVGAPSGGTPSLTSTAMPAGTVVRKVEVNSGRVSVLTDVEGSPSRAGLLRLKADTDQDRQAKKLALLLDISQKLAGEFDLDKLLQTVADTMFEVMSVDRVSVLLRNEQSGELVPRLSRSRVGELGNQHVPRSISQRAVDERVAILSDNAAQDERFKGQSILVQSVRSAMCSPLMAEGDRVLGLLYVDNLTATNSFSDEDLQFLIAFSGITALGIKQSRYVEQIKRESMVRSNFERYFAPNVAAEIAQQQQEVKLGGDKRPITILFADIRGFTSMSEKMSPDAIAHLLTEYFTEMVDIIFEHGGTLDKFMGDAIMALWGAPIAHADDPDRAIRAAVAMQQALAALNEKWVREGRPAVEIGIGINHGEVFAGNIGSHRRLEYTVIGDAVNVASRLCSKAKGGEIIVSEPFKKMLKDKVGLEALEPLELKGKEKAVKVFRVRSEA